MKCELRNVKINNRLSDETTCFSASLYIDGRKEAEVANRGCGGSNEYRFADRETEQRFYAFCKSLPPIPPDDKWPHEMAMDADLYIDQLLMVFQENKELQRWCKKDTVYRLKGDKPGTWRTLRSRTGPVFTPAVKAELQKRHGDQLAEIANERFG